ncbi:MAG: hypothetical protein KGJ24_12520, partial [Burkholderiales bacterium]|nr:hypothetical protein [Burkholderiales bacterium]
MPARLPQRLRRQLAALGLVGALMVALPLVLLLRFQNAAEHDLLQARARLNPVARTVALERSLLAHRALADRVLGGSAALEPQREQREAEVDQQLAALSAALVGGGWLAAAGEAQALQRDWARLASEVQARRIGVAQSDHEHRLLIEHCLQVLDLLGNEARAAWLQGQRVTWALGVILALLAAAAAGLLRSLRRGLQAMAAPATPPAGRRPRED